MLRRKIELCDYEQVNFDNELIKRKSIQLSWKYFAACMKYCLTNSLENILLGLLIKQSIYEKYAQAIILS